MSSYAQQREEHRQLLQSRWEKYENPWLPPRVTVPSAPPTSLPEYYDQVPGDVQPMPQQPHVVSSTIVTNASTVVNVEVVAPHSLSGCCCMDNEKSAMAILYVLLAFSAVSLVASFILLMNGMTKGFTVEMVVVLTLVAPAAILFPGSFAALNGVFRENTGGLSLLLRHLNFYWWIVFLVAIGTLISLPFFIFISPIFTVLPLIIIGVAFLFQLAFLASLTEINKVLSGYGNALRASASTLPHHHR